MGPPSGAQDTSHNTDISVTVHNINNTKATENRPAHLTAGVEELSTGKETIHDIPTTAPTVPSDFPLVNIQGIVPQDTAIILNMVTRLQGYKMHMHTKGPFLLMEYVSLLFLCFSFLKF